MKIGNLHRKKTKESNFFKEFRNKKEQEYLNRLKNTEFKRREKESKEKNKQRSEFVSFLRNLLLKKVELKIKKKKSRRSRISQARSVARKHKKEFCFVCLSKEKLQVHHIDCNVFNNREDNLQTLCVYCHYIAHRDDKKIERLFRAKNPNIDFTRIFVDSSKINNLPT